MPSANVTPACQLHAYHHLPWCRPATRFDLVALFPGRTLLRVYSVQQTLAPCVTTGPRGPVSAIMAAGLKTIIALSFVRYLFASHADYE